MMAKLSDPQKKALAALYTMTVMRERKERGWWKNIGPFFSRYDIGGFARAGCQGYPLKTMKILQGHGLVVPHKEYAVLLVEREICTCGCDRWKITDDGRRMAESMNIKILPRPTGDPIDNLF